MNLVNKLLITLFLSASSFQSEANILKIAESINEWENFTSKENGFSVDFPKKPEHIEQKIEIPKTEYTIRYNTFLSEPSDSAVYVVSVWYYPSAIDMSKPEVNLKDGFDGMLAALPGSKVIKKEVVEVGDFKALDFTVKHEEIFFQGRLLLVYNTLYQIFTVYKEEVDMTQDYEHFIDSFQLINPEKNRPQPKNDNAKKFNI